jgi:methyltransferase (TIGR00027 family)
MQAAEPSRTAQAAAFHRAVHQIIEKGHIFEDPLADRILDVVPEAVNRDAEQQPMRRIMRLFIASRSRFAEDALAKAVANGASELVVLGAGLDTYAYRGKLRERLRIFEVDHPATQEWKRDRLHRTGISIPDCLTFAPVDFERQTLADGLAAAGFDPRRQTFFTWLGVVPYLTEEAIWSTLGFVASLPNGAHVVFDYSDPPHLLSPEVRERHEKRAARVAALGEAWISFFEADELRGRLLEYGFRDVEDLGPPEIVARYFPERIQPVPEKGGHIVRAATI